MRRPSGRYVISAISDDPPRWLEKWRPMTERGAKMVVDRSAIKHRFAERTTTILLTR
jgi:hypothetical protein